MSQDYPFAILLPTTSKNVGDKIFDSLVKVSKNLLSHFSLKVPFRVYLGIDSDDPILATVEAREMIKSVFSNFYVEILEFKPVKPAKICEMWNKLAESALADKCVYFLLYGDDVNVEVANDSSTSKKWPDIVHEHFITTTIPYFGCLAINDRTSPGFPTFPIVTNTHLDIFGGSVVPNEFVNQDGDPYIWALYRRFGASHFAHEITLSNGIGGMQLLEDALYVEPRYERKHIDWQGDVLQRGVARISEWLSAQKDSNSLHNISKFVLDIIVPSYRVNRSFLLPIIELVAPDNCDLMVIVVVDDPAADIEWLRDLEKRDDKLGKLRVRKNLHNLGASMSRNVGLDETAADWVLFLDDDVEPSGDLLTHYVAAIERSGAKYDGFVGLTKLPDDEQNGLFHTAVHLSGVSFFWTCAVNNTTTPWGVTANFLFSRSCSVHKVGADDRLHINGRAVARNNMKLRFDPAFIKTGGGEDIDFCLLLRAFPMCSVPLAVCCHPWWNRGHRCYDHFYKWAVGDSLLIDKHSQHMYYNYPNVVECSFLLCFIYIGAIIYGSTPLFVASTALATTIPALFMVDCALDVYKHCQEGSEPKKHLYAAGLFRAVAAAESCVIKNGSELGHLVGPLLRGNFGNICKKFDWFCGTFDCFIEIERRSALIRFVAFVFVAVTVSLYVYTS